MSSCTISRHCKVYWSVNCPIAIFPDWNLPLKSFLILINSNCVVLPFNLSIVFSISRYLCIFRQGYGSIPIHTIFRGMNIHLAAILMFTRGTRVLTHCHVALCSCRFISIWSAGSSEELNDIKWNPTQPTLTSVVCLLCHFKKVMATKNEVQYQYGPTMWGPKIAKLVYNSNNYGLWYL